MKAKAFYGQHFLRDASVVEAIIAAADLSGDQAVLEIGPGEGVLTKRLVDVAKKVVAIDIDREAIATVSERVSSDVLQVVEQDVLTVNGGQLKAWFPSGYVLVGNIPYNITSPILKTFLSHAVPPSRAVLMVQREVADRMLAGAGDMSMLGLMVQLHAAAERVIQVPRGAFSPPPRVDSTVVRLDLYTNEDRHARGIHETEKPLTFARVAFASKRKQLQSTLGTLPNVSSEQIKAALESLGQPETARPQELSADQWVQLYHIVYERTC